MAAEHHEFHVEERAGRDHLFAAGTSLFLMAAIAAALLSQPWLRGSAAYAAGAVACLLLLRMFVREVKIMLDGTSAPVVIDASGVRYASPGEIAWADVVGIEAVPAMQRVDLLDARGEVRVSLRYDLEDAAELLQFVADMLADRWPRKTLPHEFSYRPSWGILGAGAAPVIVLCAAAYWMRSEPTVQLACFAVLALILTGYMVAWSSSVRRLAIRTEGITVIKGTRPVTIQFPSITGLEIALVREGKSKRHLDVKVTSRDKSHVYVLPRCCDPFEVYATVKAAWERGRTAAATLTRIPVPAA